MTNDQCPMTNDERLRTADCGLRIERPAWLEGHSQVRNPQSEIVRVLWLLAGDRPKADTLSLVRWVRSANVRRVGLTVLFLSAPSGRAGPAGEFAPGQTVPAALAAAGAEVLHWPDARWPGPRALRRLIRLVAARGIEIVQSVYLRADVLAAAWAELAGWRGGGRPVWLVRAAGVGPFRRVRLYGGAGGWDRLLYRRADHFVAVSAAVAADWSSRLGRPAADFTVIPNSVPAAPPARTDRATIRRRFAAGDADRLIVTVGRLEREKGLETLLEAANKCRVAGSLRWVVLGGGSLRPKLQGMIERLGLAGRLFLAGEQGDVWSHLRAADLFVLPSRMEGCPNALLEAAAAGLPIVATAVGGVPEVVRDGQEALLVPPEGGPAGLAEAVEKLLADPALSARLAAAARQRVAERFSPPRAAEQHTALCERLSG